MRAPLLKVLVAALLLGIGTPLAAEGNTSPCQIYEVRAEVSAGGATVVREGPLVVFPEPVSIVTGTEATANAWEFWFQIGQPYTNPSPGAIYFATNSALMAASGTMANAQLQLAEIAWNDAGYYEVSPSVYESQLMANVFTIASGVLAVLYSVTAGQMTIAFSDDFTELDATIDFMGRSIFTYGFAPDIPYQADIEGGYVETSSDCLTAGR